VAWLAELAAVCDRAGIGDLWERVRSGAGADGDAAAVRAAGAREFEDPRRRAHLFLAAGAPGGPSPGGRGEVSRARSTRSLPTTTTTADEAWFLRVDADIDGGPRANRGRSTSRVLGPYDEAPVGLGEPRSGVVRAVTAFRRGARDAEVRAYRPAPVPGDRLLLQEVWRAAVDLPDPRA